MNQAQALEFASKAKQRAIDADALLDEIRQEFTRDDDLPNDLLPRIDRHLDGLTNQEKT